MSRGAFGRRLKLIFSNEDGEGLDLGELSVRFEVERERGNRDLNTARLQILNPLPTTVARLNEELRKIEIVAGYQSDQRFGLIFQGEVSNVFPFREGTDTVVDVYAKDGLTDFTRAFVNLSFPTGASLRQVLRAVAQNFTATRVADFTAVEDQSLSGSPVFCAPVRSVLDGLARDFGFVWSIQNGILEIVEDGRPNGAPIVEVSPDTGMVGSPTARFDGVEVKALLNPAIVPSGLINIRTAGAIAQDSVQNLASGGIGPQGGQLVGREGGTFIVQRVNHFGETRGQSWYTTASCLPSAGV